MVGSDRVHGSKNARKNIANWHNQLLNKTYDALFFKRDPVQNDSIGAPKQ